MTLNDWQEKLRDLTYGRLKRTGKYKDSNAKALVCEIMIKRRFVQYVSEKSEFKFRIRSFKKIVFSNSDRQIVGQTSGFLDVRTMTKWKRLFQIYQHLEKRML